jgi:hypothetical protein
MTRTVYAARRVVSGNLGMLGPPVAVTLLGAGAVFAAERRFVLGAALLLAGLLAAWLTNVWALPRTRDAYMLTTGRTLRRGFARSYAARNRQMRRLRKVTDAIGALEPPDCVAGAHGEILAALRSIDDPPEARPRPLSSRTARVMMLRAEVMAVESGLPDDSVGTFSTRVSKLLEARETIASETARSVCKPLGSSFERVKRITPPTAWRDAHVRICRALASYLHTLEVFYLAVQENDTVAARASADALERSEIELADAAAPYRKEARRRGQLALGTTETPDEAA